MISNLPMNNFPQIHQMMQPKIEENMAPQYNPMLMMPMNQAP
jgi:hypothetical protein